VALFTVEQYDLTEELCGACTASRARWRSGMVRVAPAEVSG
jgi:hypothetical protein